MISGPDMSKFFEYKQHPDTENSDVQLIRGEYDEFMNQLLAAMSSSPQAFAVFDNTDRLRFGNPAFRQLFQLSDNEFPSWTELMRSAFTNKTGTKIETDDFEIWLRSAQSRRGKLPYRTIETQMEDGRWVLTTETTLPSQWMLCVVTDISELATEPRLLRQERDFAIKSSLSDDLTGVSNRRYIMSRIGDLLNDMRIKEISILLLDLDHFKGINDTFGHSGGDIVLQHFASVLQRCAGTNYYIGRIGGEEFILVSTGSDTLNNTIKILRLLFNELEHGEPFADKPEFHYSCSVGIAFSRAGETPSDVIKRADSAMYSAKSSGRKRAFIALEYDNQQLWP